MTNPAQARGICSNIPPNSSVPAGCIFQAVRQSPDAAKTKERVAPHPGHSNPNQVRVQQDGGNCQSSPRTTRPSLSDGRIARAARTTTRRHPRYPNHLPRAGSRFMNRHPLGAGRRPVARPELRRHPAAREGEGSEETRKQLVVASELLGRDRLAEHSMRQAYQYTQP